MKEKVEMKNAELLNETQVLIFNGEIRLWVAKKDDPKIVYRPFIGYAKTSCGMMRIVESMNEIESIEPASDEQKKSFYGRKESFDNALTEYYKENNRD